MEETIGTIGVMMADPGGGFIDTVLDWGLGVIRAVQVVASPPLTAVVEVITALGAVYFYIAAVLFIYWCINERLGARLAFLVLLTGCINSSLKEAFRQPRPYDLDPSLGKAYEATFGFPSGHAQSSLVFWWVGLTANLANHANGKLIWLRRLGAVLIILLIGWTRLYLGVHFPTDLFGGWALGILILLLYYLLDKPITKALLQKDRQGGSLRIQCFTAAIVAIIMNTMTNDSSLSGMFLGFGCGYALMLDRLGWHAGGIAWGKRLLSYFLGLGVVAIIYIGLSALLPKEGSA
ncbi:MAG: phosphatase PAP2 family protein, partial [Spirochaetaceae bacterium]|nr:phosphatase PAP2 family protein [Spirochaetaceae bacterium]